MIQQPKTVPVLQTPLTATTYSELSSCLFRTPTQKSPLAVDFCNTHIIAKRRHEAAFRRMTDCIDLRLPDGMPLVWVMNRRGAGLTDRVYGPTFTRLFLEKAPTGSSHYLVGGSELCGHEFRRRMLLLNPDLQFVGSFHGQCSSDGMLDQHDIVLEQLKDLRPDFIWVGLGTPKQYAWISRVKPFLTRGVLLAVGFAFDVNAGTKPDAPGWMQKRGLTWAYRMSTEPRRLAGRYLKWNTLFVWYLLLEEIARLREAKSRKV